MLSTELERFHSSLLLDGDGILKKEASLVLLLCFPYAERSQTPPWSLLPLP